MVLSAHLITLVAFWGLVQIDLREHRLPDSITLSVWGSSALVTGWLVTQTGSADIAVTAVAASALAVLAMWLLAESPGQPLGFGDVKLAGLIGMQLGWYGLEVSALAFVFAFASGGLFALHLLATGGVHWRTPIAFGPWLVVGWLGALAVSTPVRVQLGEII